MGDPDYLNACLEYEGVCVGGGGGGGGGFGVRKQWQRKRNAVGVT